MLGDKGATREEVGAQLARALARLACAVAHRTGDRPTVTPCSTCQRIGEAQARPVARALHTAAAQGRPPEMLGKPVQSAPHVLQAVGYAFGALCDLVDGKAVTDG